WLGVDVEADAGVAAGLGAGEGGGVVVLGGPGVAPGVAVDCELDRRFALFAVALRVVGAGFGDFDRRPLFFAPAATALATDRAVAGADQLGRGERAGADQD